MKLKYDHAFTEDPGHRFHRRLKKLGFLLLPGEVVHPGRHHCRFVMFRESFSEAPVYLEFIDARDPRQPLHQPGLSLRAMGSADRLYKELSRRGFNARFVHRNYDWAKGDRERRPGWNFISFKKLGFRSLYPWITEYELHPQFSRKKSTPIQHHPNGVRRVLALEIEVNAKGAEFFTKLLRLRSLARPATLPGGQTLYFSQGRTTRIRSIVLEASSLRKAHSFIPGETISWRQRRALVIDNPCAHWNLIIVGENDRL